MMKKLGKLQVKPYQLLKDRELTSLKGGGPCTCYCGPCENYGYFLGIDSHDQCETACLFIGCMLFTWDCF